MRISSQVSALSVLNVVLTRSITSNSESTKDITILVERGQACYATCGVTCYTQSTVKNGLSEGYNDYMNGKTPHGYPHAYYDRDGFDLLVTGPYLEFPILHSYRAYTGGSPGPDRVVFNTQGEYAGAVTHTGASGNMFAQRS